MYSNVGTPRKDAERLEDLTVQRTSKEAVTNDVDI